MLRGTQAGDLRMLGDHGGRRGIARLVGVEAALDPVATGDDGPGVRVRRTLSSSAVSPPRCELPAFRFASGDVQPPNGKVQHGGEAAPGQVGHDQATFRTSWPPNSVRGIAAAWKPAFTETGRFCPTHLCRGVKRGAVSVAHHPPNRPHVGPSPECRPPRVFRKFPENRTVG